MPKKEITQQAYDKLMEQKEQIKQAMQEAWRRAGEATGNSGDWHENAFYEEAKLDHERYFMQLQEIKERLSQVKIFETEPNPEKVVLGSEIILGINGRQGRYLVEDSSVAKGGATTISPDSPIGSKILGQKVGSQLTIKTPQGKSEIEILEIR